MSNLTRLVLVLLGCFGASVLSAQPQLTPLAHGLSSYTAFTSIAYGNGTFVALQSTNDSLASVGAGLRVATSTDGTTWTARTVTTTTTNNPGRIVFFNGRFVISGFVPDAANSVVWSSTNGVNWTSTPASFARTVDTWATDGTTLVGAGGNFFLMSSTDGQSFTARTAATGPGGYLSVAYGQSKWFLTTNGLGNTYTSANGTTWTLDTSSATGALGGSRVYFNPTTSTWLAYNQSNFFTSTDGTAFTNRGGTVQNPGAFIPTGTRDTYVTNGQFLQVLASPVFEGVGIYASTAGTGWRRAVAFAPALINQAVGTASAGVTDILMVGGKYYVVGNNNGQALIATADAPAPAVPPVIAAQPESKTISAGGTAVFAVSATGAIAYQWKRNNASVAGATSATLVIRNATAANAGTYTVDVTNAVGTTTSSAATLTISTSPDFGRIVNLSILTPLTTGETMTMGTAIGGAGTTGTKPLLVRAAGPSLAPLGVTSFLPDPTMTLNSTSVSPAVIVGTNNDWAGDAALSAAFAAVAAFPYTSATSKDAAIFRGGATALASGTYTVEIRDTGSGTGSVIAELYDSTPAAAFVPATPRLINVSVLKNIASGSLLTAGFVIGGSTAKTLLVRAIGPRLAQAPFGISSAMADPRLELYSGSTVIASNDNWGGDPQFITVGNAVGAFAVTDAASRDAMLLVTLAPGSYTAQAAPAAATSGGTAIIEVYEVP